MPSSSSNFWSPSDRTRHLLRFQPLYLVVAIVLFVLVWITDWQHANFLEIALYSFIAGNLTTLAMERLVRLFPPLRFSYHWLVYLSCLLPSALASSALCLLLIMVVLRIPLSNYSTEFWISGRLCVVMITIVGIIYHAYTESHIKLESRNLELQRTVDRGHIYSHQQDQELGKAREIQEGLLPKTIPQLKDLEVVGVWQPARTVGGDYFDVVKFNERKLGICIGDVVGKGFSAALLMANLQASFRAFALESVSPGTLCQKLNELFSNNLASDKFVTFCYCTIDSVDRKLTYASAGHCCPLLIQSSGAVVILREAGTPLGIMPDREYADAEAQLAPGDRLVLYTDGLTEAMDTGDQEFGEPRLVALGIRNVALSAAELLKIIMNEVSSFSGGSFQDDFTLVVVAVK
jgi:sigma-B regulation protein RsbU (phosphoserine phosphatase)